MREEDRAFAKAFFEQLGVSTLAELVDIHSFSPLQPYLKDALDKYNATVETPASAGVNAMMGRLIKQATTVMAGPSEVAGAKEEASKLPDASQESGRMILASMLAGQGDGNVLSRLLDSKKVNLRALIDAASYGEPSPDNLPADEDLKKIGLAAECGYAMPPHVCSFPDTVKAGDYLFPDLMLASIRFGHGSLMQWRHDPATVLNMMTQAAIIAADRSLGNAAVPLSSSSSFQQCTCIAHHIGCL